MTTQQSKHTGLRFHMRNCQIIALLFCLYLYSCSSDNKDIPTYTVSLGSFDDILKTEGNIEALEATWVNAPAYIQGTINNLVEEGTYVNEGDTLCIVEVQDLQLQYDNISATLEASQANLTKLEADLAAQYAILEAQVQSNNADTEIAQMDSLQLKYATPNEKRIKELELQQTLLQKGKLEKKLSALAVIQQTELRRMEIEIESHQRNLESVIERMNSLILKAPISGMAVRGISWMSGKKLQNGDRAFSRMPLVQIPDVSRVKVKILASEADYKQINVGDSVYYTFSAMASNNGYGKILMKSPVGQPLTEGSKVKYFEIEASVDSVLMLPELGFTVNCNIVLNQLNDTIVVPRIAIHEQDSVKVVYIKEKRGYRAQQVLTGFSSSKEAVITSGIGVGDIIALLPPDNVSDLDIVLLSDTITTIPVDTIINPNINTNNIPYELEQSNQ